VIKGRVKTNAIWIVACRIIQSILTLFIGTLSARYLGPGNYGLISYAASIVAFMVPIVQLGFRSTLVQEIVANPDREGETIGTALLLSSLASILGIGGTVVFVGLANRGTTDALLVCFLYSLVLLFQSVEMIQYWFQAKLMAKYTAVVSVIAYTIASIYRLILLLTEKSVYWFALTNVLDVMIIAAALVFFYHRKGGQRLRFSWLRGKEMFARSKYYIVSGVMVVIYSHTDRLMLTTMLNETINGYYSAAATCAGLANFVFAAVVDSMRPVIFEHKERNRQQYEASIATLYALVIYSTLAFGGVLAISANLVVYVLYGKAYAAAVSTVRLLALHACFAYMGSVRNIWLLAEGKQRNLLKINLIGAMLNVGMNLVLIPSYGANGAAIATVCSQCVSNVLICGMMKQLRPHVKLQIRGLAMPIRYIADRARNH